MTANHVPLTIAIITKNEEKRIASCLQTAAWANEILILDDESTDKTVEIAKSMGARCLKRKMDVEGKHRNFLYSQAKNEWVLSLDADEHVTPELQKEIGEVVSANDPGFSGYSVPMRIFMGSRWIHGAGYYPSPRLKLFRRDKFRYEETGVHPRVFLDGKCGRLKSEILHYSFRDWSHFIEKFNRETDLEAAKWIQDKRKMSFALAFYKACDRFLRAYIGKKGYQDGYMGFLLSCFSSWYQLVTFAKYYDLKKTDH